MRQSFQFQSAECRFYEASSTQLLTGIDANPGVAIVGLARWWSLYQSCVAILRLIQAKHQGVHTKKD
jgi:hypothetical protein